MTMVAGSQSGHSKKSARNDGSRGSKSTSSSSGGGGGSGSGVVGGTGGVVVPGAHCETESDTSISPSTEFSNMPTYRVPCKSTRSSDERPAAGAYGWGALASKPVARYLYPLADMFRPDSSTESNNEQGSPVERRISGPRQLGGVPGGGGGVNGGADKRGHRSRKQQQQLQLQQQQQQQQQLQLQAKEHQTLDRRICPGSNNR